MGEETGNGVPSSLEVAWERHGRREAEPKQGLSLRRIVMAAIEVADAEGLDAVSMSKVASRLGFTTMSLYRHVRNKDELLLFMQDAAVGPPTVLDAPGESGWRAQLERWAWAVVGAFRAHPWVLRTIPMFGAPATPNQLAWLERGLRALRGTPLHEAEKMQVMLLVNGHVISDLQFASFASPTAVGAVGPDPYGTVLPRVLDEEHFPALLGALMGGAFDPGADPAAERDANFAFGLARILDGVERLMQSRAET